ncbi:hypothetical protein [Streptomyces sp. NBC_01794]|uniref:hypothetical protein n=1 Tax=Streptomyces sp. NBC_01794 TaxID=2975942 RepID=UPI00308CC9E2|nr:hypothetical protein OIE54_20280 [Streptomyces sp. NBC_01794]
MPAPRCHWCDLSNLYPGALPEIELSAGTIAYDNTGGDGRVLVFAARAHDRQPSVAEGGGGARRGQRCVPAQLLGAHRGAMRERPIVTAFGNPEVIWASRLQAEPVDDFEGEFDIRPSARERRREHVLAVVETVEDGVSVGDSRPDAADADRSRDPGARALLIQQAAQRDIARHLRAAFPDELDEVGAGALVGAMTGAVSGALYAPWKTPKQPRHWPVHPQPLRARIRSAAQAALQPWAPAR